MPGGTCLLRQISVSDVVQGLNNLTIYRLDPVDIKIEPGPNSSEN